jgi:hypothetical protein
MGELLRDPRAAEPWIRAFPVDDSGDELAHGPLSARACRGASVEQGRVGQMGNPPGKALRVEKACGEKDSFESRGTAVGKNADASRRAHAGTESLWLAAGTLARGLPPRSVVRTARADARSSADSRPVRR